MLQTIFTEDFLKQFKRYINRGEVPSRKMFKYKFVLAKIRYLDLKIMGKIGFRFGHKYQNFKNYSDKISAHTVEILSIQWVLEYFLPVFGIFSSYLEIVWMGDLGYLFQLEITLQRENIKSIQNFGMVLRFVTDVFHPPLGLLL